MLMLQRPGEAHAVWHFWDGPDRDFRCWYLNLQSPFRRTSIGYDTQDLELDIVVAPDGSFVLKDLELMDQRVADGRFTPELVAEVIVDGDRIMADLAAGGTGGTTRGRAGSRTPAGPPPPCPTVGPTCRST